jgi:hypothetical protein
MSLPCSSQFYIILFWSSFEHIFRLAHYLAFPHQLADITGGGKFDRIARAVCGAGGAPYHAHHRRNNHRPVGFIIEGIHIPATGSYAQAAANTTLSDNGGAPVDFPAWDAVPLIVIFLDLTFFFLLVSIVAEVLDRASSTFVCIAYPRAIQPRIVFSSIALEIDYPAFL